jgi:2-polyprenyl-3-methyl-5-hydroxy-6-metoxy-1,4-benzoquinol methylase
MSNNTVLPAIPDYGWDGQDAPGSQTYLLPGILREIESLKFGSNSVRVFDAGCGNGTLLRALHNHGYVVAGCDASASGVNQARLSCGANVRVEQLSVYDELEATFGNNWDVVIGTEVIEHLYSPRIFLRQALRLLRPGGMLVLSTPYHGYLKNLVLAATGKLDAHFTALWDGGHIKFWSYRTLTQLLKEFELNDFKFVGAGRIPGLWKSMIVTCRKPA